MLNDLRFAVRSLARAPGFVVAAVLCLGLGLGANTTVYSLVNALLLRPPPYAHVDRLVSVELTKVSPSRGTGHSAVSVPYLLDLRERARAFDGVVGYAGRTMSLLRREGAEAVAAARVSADYFDVVGVRPALGRAFRADESAPGAAAVALLSDELWRSHFGASPAVVGTSVVLDGVPTTIVGVMPPSLGILGDREAVWAPLTHTADVARRGDRYLSVIGRLRPGVSREAAARELAAVGARIDAEYGAAADGDGWVPTLQPFRDTLVPAELTPVFGAMLGAVGFVLFVACACVANLLLARTAARQRELTLRVALGAGRGRVMRLVVLESVLVALGGGALGAAIAYAAIGALVRSITVAYPSWIVFAVDGPVLAYTLALSLVTGVVFGLLPARYAVRSRPAPQLRSGGRGASAGGRRLREGLIAGALALSLVLLVGAGVMIKDVLRLSTIDPGFSTRGVLAARVYLAGDRFATTAQRLAFVTRALERAGAVPGVERVSMMTRPPLGGGVRRSELFVDGRGDEPAPGVIATWLPTSGNALAALGVPLRAGRDLTPAEGRDSVANVVVLNETLARRLWPNESALGRRIGVPNALPNDSALRWLTVVGVARDVVTDVTDRRGRGQLWLPWPVVPSRQITLLVAARGDAGAGALAPAVRRALADVDPLVPTVELRTLDGVAGDALWRFRLYATLFGMFAAAALVLAIVGVYGVVAYQVAQRTRELGTRVALGAQPRDIYRLVVGNGTRLAAVGLGAGLVLALGLTQLLRAALHGVSATDPVVFGGVTLALAATTLLACWIPARRATRVDPVTALGTD